jgi:hypothetical protein
MKLPIDTVQQARFDCLVEAMMRMTFLHRLLDIAMDSGHRSFVRGTVYGARCSFLISPSRIPAGDLRRAGQ